MYIYIGMYIYAYTYKLNVCVYIYTHIIVTYRNAGTLACGIFEVFTMLQRSWTIFARHKAYMFMCICVYIHISKHLSRDMCVYIYICVCIYNVYVRRIWEGSRSILRRNGLRSFSGAPRLATRQTQGPDPREAHDIEA